MKENNMVKENSFQATKLRLENGCLEIEMANGFKK